MEYFLLGFSLGLSICSLIVALIMRAKYGGYIPPSYTPRPKIDIPKPEGSGFYTPMAIAPGENLDGRN